MEQARGAVRIALGHTHLGEETTMFKFKWFMVPVLVIPMAVLPVVTPATPARQAFADTTVQRATVTMKLHSGTKLTLALPAGATITKLGAGASMVPAGAQANGNGGGRVQPQARVINITTPGNNSYVAVNQYQTFTYQWSGGGCCDETFHSKFTNLTAGGTYEFDTYHCATFCDSGGHSFPKLFATKGNRWSYTVYDQNNNASNTIQFTTY